MNLLSIQSHVAYGHVGNSAAVFPLQRIGVEVWPVHTVQYSNHRGYGHWRGRVFSGEALRMVVEGIDERGVLGECDGVISGYLPSTDVGEAVVETVGRVKGANPSARYCCDPVIGDVTRGVFVRRDVPEFIRDRALPHASARPLARRSPASTHCMHWAHVSCWSLRSSSTRRRTTPPISSFPTTAGASACARRGCRWR
jgi:pyridoxine kinase